MAKKDNTVKILDSIFYIAKKVFPVKWKKSKKAKVFPIQPKNF